MNSQEDFSYQAFNHYRKRLSLEDKRKQYALVDLQEFDRVQSVIVNYLNDVDLDFKVFKKEHPNVRYALVRRRFEKSCTGTVCDLGYEFITGFDSYEDVLNGYEIVKGFSKGSRSKWPYWFAHWCAFQLTAITLHCWKLKYLLHDIEKPFLLSFSKDYSWVQSWHRKHNRHHTEWALWHDLRWDKIDWEAAIIDWECSALTKSEAQMNARETLDWLVGHGKWQEYKDQILEHALPVLKRLGL